MTRSRARLRRTIARAATVFFGLVVLVAALDVRGIARDLPCAEIGLLATQSFAVALVALLWFVAACRKRGVMRWIARVGVGVLVAGPVFQLAARRYFGVYVDYRAARGLYDLPGVNALAVSFVKTVLCWIIPPATGAVALAMATSHLAPAHRRAASLAFVAAATLSAGGIALTVLPYPIRSDVVATQLNASVPSQKTNFFSRQVPPLPRVKRTKPIRDVLFILTESVRASAMCSAHGADCPHNPFSNAAAPDRFAFERMRAVDTFTLLSFGVIFTGLPVDAPKDDWLDAPLLFDFAHAARLSTAYWSAQHPEFASSHAWTDGEPIDALAWATDFDPKADEALGADDALVAQRATASLASLHEPFFAVVHYSGTHFPYRIDDRDAPFVPQSSSFDRGDASQLRNRYFDAVYRQDQLTAGLIHEVRSAPFGPRTVIVFVSDHGESFYEHDSVLHGSSLWDPELRVPMWIDAPAGALTKDEAASLASLRDVSLTAVDLAPTILDLLGIADAPELAPFTSHMAGTSMLRFPEHDRVTKIATCNALWSCIVPSSGELIGDRKYVTRPPEPFRCFDTRSDPDEHHDLGAAACGR